jgi:hypothetical protein
MTYIKIMNAKQANYTATSYNEKNNSAEFVGILERIKSNAHKGIFSIEVKSISLSTRKALEKDGYKIVDGYSEYSIRWD